MKKIIHFGLTALFYVSFATASPAPSTQDQLQFRLIQDTLVVVAIRINDLGPFDFILDTGTDTTLVDPRLASSLQLVPLDRMTLTTPIGKQVLVRTALGKVVLGSATASDVEGLVQDMPALRKLSPHIRGILGQNFLSHFNYVLDYRHKFLYFESENELRDSSLGARVPLEAPGRMVIQSEISPLGVGKARLLLDSAANNLVLFRRLERLGPLQQGEDSSVTDSRNAARTSTLVRIDSLTICDQHLHDLKLAYLPPGIGDSRFEDGLLPTILFRALYVNNREGFVVLNPRFAKG
ncbi:MAG TPA: aspartyl protease family protein [Candidatus Angelobacter sp.]